MLKQGLGLRITRPFLKIDNYLDRGKMSLSERIF